MTKVQLQAMICHCDMFLLQTLKHVILKQTKLDYECGCVTSDGQFAIKTHIICDQCPASNTRNTLHDKLITAAINVDQTSKQAQLLAGHTMLGNCHKYQHANRNAHPKTNKVYTQNTLFICCGFLCVETKSKCCLADFTKRIIHDLCFQQT